MTQIIPAIDIIEGRCVRLSQGDFNRTKLYDTAPLEMAKMYEDAGVKRLHLVDLDGAKAGAPCNLRALEHIAGGTGLWIEWGGGVRDMDSMKSVLDAGASGVICGSMAISHPELFRQFLSMIGPDKAILGADISKGKVAVKGWLELSSMGIEELVECFLPDGLSQVICTDISKDGMLSGPSVELYEGLMKRFPAVRFTVSGGVSSMADIEKLNDAGLPAAIVGKAIFEGKITLKEIEQWQLRG